MAAKMGIQLASSSSRLLQQSGSAARLGAGRRTFSLVAAAGPEARGELRAQLPVAMAAALSLVGSAATPAAALAQDAPAVDTAVSSIVDIVKATGEVVKQGVDYAKSGAELARSAYDYAAPVVKSAVETATPVVEKGVRSAVEAAGPALQSGLQQASKALAESTGVDPGAAAGPLVEGTGQAVNTAAPFLQQAINFLAASEPAALGQYALALVAAYYLLPTALKAGAGVVRGYAGDVSAAAALTAVSEGNADAVIVDIRVQREKEAGGVPDIPNTGKLVELEYASIVDGKVRSQLRSAVDLEVKVTALQIAALKRLRPGMSLFMLDRTGGGSAKAVAKALAERGFGRVYVIKGGFQGWQASKLRVKSASTVSRVEILAPGTFGSPAPRALPSGNGATKAFPASASTVSNRRALPSTTSGSN